MTQVTTVRKIQAHESSMGRHQRLVNLQIGRAAAEALHIDTPLGWIQAESLQGSLLASDLNGVNVLVPAIVTSSGIALGVFVAHGRTQGIEDRARGNILRGDEKDGLALTLDLFFLRGESVHDHERFRRALTPMRIKISAERNHCHLP